MVQAQPALCQFVRFSKPLFSWEFGCRDGHLSMAAGQPGDWYLYILCSTAIQSVCPENPHTVNKRLSAREPRCEQFFKFKNIFRPQGLFTRQHHAEFPCDVLTWGWFATESYRDTADWKQVKPIWIITFFSLAWWNKATEDLPTSLGFGSKNMLIALLNGKVSQ